MKKTIILALTFAALNSQAMSKVEQARVLEKLSAVQTELQTLKSLIPKVYRPVISKNLDSINQKIQDASNIVAAVKIRSVDQTYLPPQHSTYPSYPVYPSYPINEMSASCYAITDDEGVPSVDSVATIFGVNVNELFKQCFLVSSSKYPSRTSVSIGSLKVVQNSPTSVVATCTSFSQFGGSDRRHVHGDIVGSSLEDVRRQCQTVANDGSISNEKIELTNIYQ